MLYTTDETVVLDCGNQIFTRSGLAQDDDQTEGSDSAQLAMQALVQQLVQNRVPAPGVLRLDQVIPIAAYLFLRFCLMA